jgi:transcriptional regulator with XRE-family HTH domain
MLIGNRLKEIRESKDLSQGDIEKRTGLLRCYISRVENGHTVPSIETLEKMARALEIPMYQLFYDGEDAKALKIPNNGNKPTNKETKIIGRLSGLISRMKDRDQKLIMDMARKMARA